MTTTGVYNIIYIYERREEREDEEDVDDDEEVKYNHFVVLLHRVCSNPQ